MGRALGTRWVVRLLVVDDELAIGRLVERQLRPHGLDVSLAVTCREALAIIVAQPVDIVILDLGLPDASGLDVLDALVDSGSSAHVIILSGATDESDCVDALTRGADDYVTKPFSAAELTARVLAVVRRRAPSPEADVLRVGALTVDPRSHTALADGEPLELTGKEFGLLAFLAARPGHVFGREDLLAAVWESSSEWQQASTVTEHVRRLRSKLERDPSRPRLLRTVRGVGYRLDPVGADGLSVPTRRRDGGERP
ncbi:response regulator transcription factor [soil metagenome]